MKLKELEQELKEKHSLAGIEKEEIDLIIKLLGGKINEHIAN